MVWTGWIGAGLIGVLLVAAAVLLIGAWVSLDPKKRHTAETAALSPLRAPQTQPDGLTTIEVGELTFRTRVANLGGSGDGVILLHGFPQTSIAWEPLLAAAGAKGFRLAAFDQRGYSPGARPDGVDAYSIDKMITDVLGVADALGFDRFHLVGHDWGAAVGWGLVMSQPARVRSWTALSVPHAFAFGEAVRNDKDQRKRSRYFLLFRVPLLPELLLSFNRHQVLRQIMYQWMPESHVEEYLRVFAEPGALTGAFNWYRAVGRGGTSTLPPEIHTPTLFIWGNRDPAIGRTAFELQDQYMRGPCEKIELDAGHWLLERRTEPVVNRILEHLRAWSGRSGTQGPI